MHTRVWIKIYFASLQFFIWVPLHDENWFSKRIIALNQVVIGIFFGLILFDQSNEFLSDLFDLVFHCLVILFMINKSESFPLYQIWRCRSTRCSTLLRTKSRILIREHFKENQSIRLNTWRVKVLICMD